MSCTWAHFKLYFWTYFYLTHVHVFGQGKLMTGVRYRHRKNMQPPHRSEDADPCTYGSICTTILSVILWKSVSNMKWKEDNAINPEQKETATLVLLILHLGRSWSWMNRVDKKKKKAPHVKAASGVNLGLPSSWLYEVSEKHREVFHTVEHVNPITCFHCLCIGFSLSLIFSIRDKRNCADTSRLMSAFPWSSIIQNHLHRDKPEGRCQSLKQEASAYVVVQNNRSLDTWNPNSNMGVASDADAHPESHQS